MEKAWFWTEFEPINVDNHRLTSFGLHTDERIVTTFNPVHFQIQGFSSVVRMSVYFCLVVVALLVPVTDSAICVPPDQFESTSQIYNKEIYSNVSNSVSRRLNSVTTFALDQNNKAIVFGRTVFDYNVMAKFVIPANAPCTNSKIKKDINREIPDNAVRVENFPLPLPDDLPEGIEYWRFKWANKNDVIVGVLRFPPNICPVVVWGPYNKRNELIIEEVAYIRGNYSLSIRNMNVFHVPPRCLPRIEENVV